jgi:hypothetical protein
MGPMVRAIRRHQRISQREIAGPTGRHRQTLANSDAGRPSALGVVDLCGTLGGYRAAKTGALCGGLAGTALVFLAPLVELLGQVCAGLVSPAMLLGQVAVPLVSFNISYGAGGRPRHRAENANSWVRFLARSFVARPGSDRPDLRQRNRLTRGQRHERTPLACSRRRACPREHTA